VPESPRRLFIHGREDEGEEIVHDLERTVSEESGNSLPSVSALFSAAASTVAG
jgi:hypothetical protein